jgi:hypothetical protein
MNEKQKIISGVVAIMASHIVVFSLGEVVMWHRLTKRRESVVVLMENALSNISNKATEEGMTEGLFMEVVKTEMEFVRMALR